MTPLKDRVIIKCDQMEKTTRGGIIIPDTATGIRRDRGTVMAVGKGEWLSIAGRYREPEVKVGDRVLYSHVAGVFIDEEKTMLNIRECDIIAIVDDEVTMTPNPYNGHARDVA